MQSEFAKVEEEIILKNKNLFLGSITCDDFLWAFGILRSRAFSRLRGDNLALIPFADLVGSSITSKFFVDKINYCQVKSSLYSVLYRNKGFLSYVYFF